MKSMGFVLEVERVLCSSLPAPMRMGQSHVLFQGEIRWEKIGILPPASLVISEKMVDNNVIHSTELKFKALRELPKGNGKYAWRVTFENGVKRLIGGNSRPFAQVSTVENAPDRVTDNRLTEVTVTYESASEPPIIA